MLAALALVMAGQQVGSEWTPTGQKLEPYGTLYDLGSRPVDLLAKGQNVYIKDDTGIRLYNPKAGKVTLTIKLKGGTSLTGMAWRENGPRLYATDAASGLVEIDPTTLSVAKTIALPKPKVGGEAFGCGVAYVKGNNRLYVCGNRGNELLEVDPDTGETTRRLSLAPAPYDVIQLGNGKLAVSCWGRRPKARSATSSGTPVEVDERGIGTGGTLAIVNPTTWKVEREVNVGSIPTALAALPGGRVAVACANADTLEVLLPNGKVRKTVLRANGDDAFGSAPNGMSLLGNRLLVSLGGANALAVVDINREEKLTGLIPTGWYPGPVSFLHGTPSSIVVGNIKGRAGSKGVYEFHGSLQSFAWPLGADAAALTATAKRLAKAPREIPARRNVTPKPVPAKLGDPSPIQHIVYVIKENRTYDQVLGDMKEGDGDASLCIYGEKITPNAHALAREYVLLDNYYCNGVNSADGHAWSIEGNASAFFERTFGGWTRSYPFGDEPLSTTATGYLWDHILAGGRSFRNHGEYDYASPFDSKTTFFDLLEGRGLRFKQNIGVERLRRYSSNVPGWNMGIPDQVRADRFIAELKKAEESGVFPNLSILYLPEDHTNGTAPGTPTPRALVADNDLAMGRAIEALSKSKFWPKTAVFVIEDDPQAGFDHVDGHRSICYVVSPYTKGRGKLSEFYNQTSVLRTMLRILGLPPRTRFEASSPLMTDVFRSKADLTAYRAHTPDVPLTEVNPPAEKLSGRVRKDALASARLPLEKPDQIDDDAFNRILWRNRKPGLPYPEAYAGAHGKGLRGKGLILHGGKAERDGDDDDD